MSFNSTKAYTNEELLIIISNILRQECQISQPVHIKTKLLDDLELDSVGLLTLVLGVENYFEIILEEEESELPQQLDLLIDLLQEQLAIQEITKK